jgi:proprotein convertase subtilisin/kexin type 5
MWEGHSTCRNLCLYNNDVLTGEYYFNTNDASDTSYQYCGLCHPSCTTCTGVENTDCSVCLTGYYYDSANTACVSTCGAGQYDKAADNSCAPCHADCSYCSGPTNTECLACANAAMYLNVDTCVASCGIGQVADDATQTCINCHDRCEICADHTYE